MARATTSLPTGHATPDEVEDVKRMGAVDVIAKPAALTHYHRALERLHRTEPPRWRRARSCRRSRRSTDAAPTPPLKKGETRDVIA